MGNTSSTVASPQEEERKRLERFGVLVPPSFGVGTDSLPPSSAARLPSPFYLETLERDLLCYRILEEHMTPGMWVSATTPSQASVLASYVMSKDSFAEGMICASQQWQHGQVDVRAHSSASPRASGYYSPVPGCKIQGHLNGSGVGWLGCHVDASELMKRPSEYYRNDPFQQETDKYNIQLGSWLRFDSPTTKVTNLSHVPIQDVSGYAAVDVARCTVAMEATVPIKTLDPQFSYHISCDLNADEGPPLVVTMRKTPTGSSMNLSQVLTFDRTVVNPVEVRCPKVRNTLGWAVQMEQQGDSMAQLTAAAAWQINRAVAIKCVADLSGGEVKGALLLKRWRQPRVLCSLLVGKAPGKEISFGIGLELETGPRPDDYYQDKVDGRSQVTDGAPPTKATLPMESPDSN